jgi:hypothetical protein
MPVKIISPLIKAGCGPREAARGSPVTKMVCLQGKWGTNVVHFRQDDAVAIFMSSNQELAVERNTDNIGEDLQMRVLVHKK